MHNMFRVTRCFLMLATVYCGVMNAMPSSEPSSQQASIDCTNEFMATFLKPLSDNEKVIYKDGKIAFMQSQSKLTTAVAALAGAAFLTAGMGFTYLGYAGHGNRQDAMNALFLGGIFALGGLGFSGVAIYRLVKHFSKEVFIVLDDEGLMERRVRQLSWNKVAKIDIENLRVYNQYGILVSTTRIVYLTDKSGNDLYSLSENDESLPITFDKFLVVLEHYWNKNKGNV